MKRFGIVQPNGSIKYPTDLIGTYLLVETPRYPFPPGTKVYVIDGGDTFEGTAEQFEDCFGGPSTEYYIRQWCEQSGCTLSIITL